MMEPLNIMLVGCRIMGTRHVRGYTELERAQSGYLYLQAVCDPLRFAADLIRCFQFIPGKFAEPLGSINNS